MAATKVERLPCTAAICAGIGLYFDRRYWLNGLDQLGPEEARPVEAKYANNKLGQFPRQELGPCSGDVR